jgi:hypothetical protein
MEPKLLKNIRELDHKNSIINLDKKQEMKVVLWYYSKILL